MEWNTLASHLLPFYFTLLLRFFLVVFLITDIRACTSQENDSLFYIYVDVSPTSVCPNPQCGYKEMNENVEYLLARSFKALVIRKRYQNETWKGNTATVSSKSNCTLSAKSLLQFDCFVNWHDLHFDYSIVKPEEPGVIYALSKAYSIFDLDTMLTVQLRHNGIIGISRVSFIHSEMTAKHRLVMYDDDHLRNVLLFGLRTAILRFNCYTNLRKYIMSSISDV